MKELPEKFKELDISLSNFDNIMPEKVEEKLKAGEVWCAHFGWDHFGFCWYEEGEFHQQVMVYKSHVATISGETFKQVVADVNDQFGYS